MIIKEGVVLTGIRAEIVLALVIAESILLRHGQPLVIVDAVIAEPTDDSPDYAGAGVAIHAEASGAENRTAAIAEALGSGYDVALYDNLIFIDYLPEPEEEENAGSDDRELEGAAPEISETHDRDEGSGGEVTLDSDGSGAEPDASGEPTD